MQTTIETKPNNEKRHYTFMDLLRVLSFLIIVVYHFLKDLSVRGLTQFPDPDTWMKIGNVHLCMIAVGLFFLLSGAGLAVKLQTQERIDWKQYYCDRFRKILVPFYLVWIIYAIIKGVQTRLTCFAGIPFWRIIFTVLGMDEYVSMTGHATFSLGIGEWFLGALVMLNLIFPVIYTFFRKNKWITMAGFTVYYVILILFYRSPINWYMNVFVKLYEFVLGIFLAMCMDEIKGKPWLLLLFAGVFLPVHPAFVNTIVCAAVFIGGILAEKLLSKAQSFSRVLTVASKYSYELFLVHHAIIYAFSDLLMGKVVLGKKLLLLLFFGELLCMALAAAFVKAGTRWILKRGIPAGRKKHEA